MEMAWFFFAVSCVCVCRYLTGVIWYLCSFLNNKLHAQKKISKMLSLNAQNWMITERNAVQSDNDKYARFICIKVQLIKSYTLTCHRESCKVLYDLYGLNQCKLVEIAKIKTNAGSWKPNRNKKFQLETIFWFAQSSARWV